MLIRVDGYPEDEPPVESAVFDGTIMYAADVEPEDCATYAWVVEVSTIEELCALLPSGMAIQLQEDWTGHSEYVIDIGTPTA